MSSKLFAPLKVGDAQLQHRLVMAPLTRFRAEDNHVPQLPLSKEYYEQRASVPGTLLITEATFIAPQAGGYPNVPGIYNADQIKAWKEITDAVHAKGSYIYLQLWALGRAAYPAVLKAEGDYDLVSSSAVPMEEGAPTPRALTEEEIKSFIGYYTQAAKNAVEAGFDGVEIHSANGYLIDQFLQDNSNKRTDGWGGSIEKRARFCLEITKSVVDAIGSKRTGLRLSPWSPFQGMRMADPIPQFSYVIKELKKFNLSYLHLVNSRMSGGGDNLVNKDRDSTPEQIDFAVDIWANQSPVIVAGGFKPDTAKTTVDEEFADHDVAVAFGRYFIANPDLPYRIQHGIDLVPYNRDTFYKTKSADGYTDYPFSKEFVASSKI
ncbi:MAG: Chanoclavine-I aldehyde reductase fgaOx3 [Sarea resinae]|nr:MAG: Chanoclavine-I aldehyde reductase fgaOx3 [Sarea resinae]